LEVRELVKQTSSQIAGDSGDQHLRFLGCCCHSLVVIAHVLSFGHRPDQAHLSWRSAMPVLSGRTVLPGCIIFTGPPQAALADLRALVGQNTCRRIRHVPGRSTPWSLRPSFAGKFVVRFQPSRFPEGWFPGCPRDKSCSRWHRLSGKLHPLCAKKFPGQAWAGTCHGGPCLTPCWEERQ